MLIVDARVCDRRDRELMQSLLRSIPADVEPELHIRMHAVLCGPAGIISNAVSARSDNS
jgi:hypothetical protein